MKALILYGPGNYKVENDWHTPKVPEGWALVKVAYAGICGSDIPRFFTTGSYHHPMIIGHEFSGVVAQKAVGGKNEVGAPVAILPIIPCGTCAGCRETHQPFHCAHYQFIGSRNDGGFAEYVAVPDENLFPLGSEAELKLGAMIELLSVGLHVVRRSGIDGRKAVVFGAGPIGLAVAMWLQFLGNDVTIVDVREFSLSIARSLGLTAVPFAELDEEKRYEHAFEASGSGSALVKAVDIVKDLGTITVVGRNTGDTVFSVKQFEKLMRKELTLNGCWGYDLAGEEERMRAFLGSHDPNCMISHLITLDEVPNVLETVVKPRGEYCKIMIDMGGKL